MAGSDFLGGENDTSGYTNTANISRTYEFHSREVDGGGTEYIYTNGVAGTADAIGVYINAISSAETVKLVVSDGSGNILGQTASASTSGFSNGWNDIDLVSTFLVSDSDSLSLWVAVGPGGFGYLNIYHGTTNYMTVKDTSGTYASPPDPIGSVSSYAIGKIALRLMGTFTAAAGGNLLLSHPPDMHGGFMQ